MATVAIVRDDVGLNEMLYDFTYKRVLRTTRKAYTDYDMSLYYTRESYTD